MSEKQSNSVIIDSDDVARDQIPPEWSAKEERSLVRRIDFAVMPLLIIGFFVLQLDRSNIGNAMTDNFMAEVGINQFQYNVGNQLMYLGIVIFEIPSNLVLYRVGPAVWIGFQILAWGLVATFQAFIKGQGYGAYLATRFLLGICECGYIPAALFTITRFYKQEETSKRFGIFFVGNMAANGAAGLLAFGILRMRGIGGLSGWQWLFLIEGMLTLVVAVAFILFFPRSTAKPVSLVGLRYFNEHEAKILTARVLRDDSTKVQARTNVSREELKAALTNWRLIGHVLTTILCLSAQASLFAFAPSIVATYGYGKLQANAMTSIGYWILLVTTVTWGWIADKWGKRGPMVLLGVVIGWALIIANRVLVRTDKVDAKFAILTLIIAFSFNWHPVHASWVSLNAKSAGERSVTMAIFIMAANTSGIVSGQLFQAKDAPRYQTAWTATVALSCAGVAVCTWTNLQYWWLNRRNARKGYTTFVYSY
ncbi:MFS domain-containing protein [Fusarium keratoplasticum]|uniref:MFS domain-containing protein n=1 Tax=Fusarium keratoplasticum TaxID=1328300 RepID=A0ACC0QS07_9HYPO|nr:MFS domain-containing protein [Fusarium keratoplasticum]KAI8665924.1 MFS domain-containing protein [Fusarium keratoplasticum]